MRIRACRNSVSPSPRSMLTRPMVAADAVLRVHHRVADLQLRQVAQHALRRALRSSAARGARRADAGVELGLGDDSRAFGRQRRSRWRAARRRARTLRRWRGTRRSCRTSAGLQAVLGEVVAACVSRRPGDSAQISTRSPRSVEEVAAARRADRSRAAVDRDGRQRRECRRARRLRRRRAASMRANGLARDEEFLRRQEQLCGGSSGRSRSPRRQLVARVACRARSRWIAASTSPCRRELRVCGQVVEERRGLVEEQRQVILDAGRRDAVATTSL